MNTALIVLAAGQGSRMKSDLPKVLHEVAGASLLVHALRSGDGIDPARIVVVTGHGGAQVAAAARDWREEISIATQEEQLGTAHAVAQASAALAEFEGDAVVLYGDTPFIAPDTLRAMLDERRAGADVVVLGFEAADPGSYGRLKTGPDGLEAIVEAKEATPEELAITLCNSGVICADRATLFELIEAVDNKNAKGEYYLTDIVEIARGRALRCAAVTCDEAETLGVNSRRDMAAAETVFQSGMRAAMMDNGVTLQSPDTTYFSFDTHIGPDTVVGPHVVFGPGVTVENGAEIRAFSHLEDCHVARGAQIGPYARLRPGAELQEGARVGNFCEIKNAVVEPGAKVNHLTYIGDARVGEKANIGAGTITCNYDGVFKHHTDIGAGAFIGSNSALVAPVSIAQGGYVASGSVVTSDVGPGDLAIARARQVNKTGLGARMVARLKAMKEKR
ncbi:bifunctional UDP-N-acetylglucosamine diphosphorylase/glucosamine-1-phosphate N-acetyltransferase GlmU [Pontivivens insulae]|uniref:Bifunctional protein GlmU n=1 Tax=Pontivivens insulae TaxID=1639689 RepID=A0A2R8ACV8_9RHOB|nr:bifunctional UDP-N-acetylglucosamine diphosphorylase/glucosamine-1-phosphate N-acetyltransferase GlmU [Pontivivens insulae]RED13804.1 UDP-N-acetylglucosamine pyrophosphorylase /glucosamine-1-phosphate N-acetyltransferase [Pontivivens insulae]SPF29878.1 Bifunctional protein GlmU [Pontivivens insulae]